MPHTPGGGGRAKIPPTRGVWHAMWTAPRRQAGKGFEDCDGRHTRPRLPRWRPMGVLAPHTRATRLARPYAGGGGRAREGVGTGGSDTSSLPSPPPPPRHPHVPIRRAPARAAAAKGKVQGGCASGKHTRPHCTENIAVTQWRDRHPAHNGLCIHKISAKIARGCLVPCREFDPFSRSIDWG